jgi:hypothetical protein
MGAIDLVMIVNCIIFGFINILSNLFSFTSTNKTRGRAGCLGAQLVFYKMMKLDSIISVKMVK